MAPLLDDIGNRMQLEGDSAVTDEKRFCDNGDGTITDNETKLMWKQTDAYQDTSKWTNWFMAVDYIKSLNLKKSFELFFDSIFHLFKKNTIAIKKRIKIQILAIELEA